MQGEIPQGFDKVLGFRVQGWSFGFEVCEAYGLGFGVSFSPYLGISGSRI